MVYLITGKRDAGKTHYAETLAQEIIDNGGKAVVIDGDQHRAKTGNQDFSDEGRMANLMSAAELARQLEEQGNVVILAFIAPRREWRYKMRELWDKSKVIYIPGGTLWEKTNYDVPDLVEQNFMTRYEPE